MKKKSCLHRKSNPGLCRTESFCSREYSEFSLRMSLVAWMCHLFFWQGTVLPLIDKKDELEAVLFFAPNFLNLPLNHGDALLFRSQSKKQETNNVALNQHFFGCLPYFLKNFLSVFTLFSRAEIIPSLLCARGWWSSTCSSPSPLSRQTRLRLLPRLLLPLTPTHIMTTKKNKEKSNQN